MCQKQGTGIAAGSADLPAAVIHRAAGAAAMIAALVGAVLTLLPAP
jgi:hypothetical protein